MAVIDAMNVEADDHHLHHLLHPSKPKFVAAIFGVTGLVGRELAKKLLSTTSRHQWKVYGIARTAAPSPETMIHNENYHYISCNLQNPSETHQNLSPLTEVTHIFWVTWSSQHPLDSPECCEDNRAMMSNVLNAMIPRSSSLKHLSLQTGTKHYISFEKEDDSGEIQLYHEQCPRVGNGQNFYYVLEDLLHERLGGRIPWSIHRPGLIMGCSHRSVFNYIGSICVYGTICKRLGLPFMFGGTKECWEEMCIDASDARLVAEQHIWAATEESIQCAHGQAFNAINGSGFSWKQIWPAIGLQFGLIRLDCDSRKTDNDNDKDYNNGDELLCRDFKFSGFMADKGGIWREIVEEEGLVRTEMSDLANWELLDVLFRFPRKMLGSRHKADGLGFEMRFQTLDSILYWIDVMRKEKLIP